MIQGVVGASCIRNLGLPHHGSPQSCRPGRVPRRGVSQHGSSLPAGRETQPRDLGSYRWDGFMITPVWPPVQEHFHNKSFGQVFVRFGFTSKIIWNSSKWNEMKVKQKEGGAQAAVSHSQSHSLKGNQEKKKNWRTREMTTERQTTSTFCRSTEKFPPFTQRDFFNFNNRYIL